MTLSKDTSGAVVAHSIDAIKVKQHTLRSGSQAAVATLAVSEPRSKSDNIAPAATPSCFPFTAIVGQDEMKAALLIAAVDPAVGGVLVLGDRGTGKSTAVRALSALLPKLTVALGCRYNCDPYSSCDCPDCRPAFAGPERVTKQIQVPMVDLPLGATEDRVVGSLDIEKALIDGVRSFQPGILARANRGFLYIDEVNLLEDHLVDLLIDVAASGVNIVEREGLSIRHAACFVLVGSGNPEEGELRPQLLDRFGLSVEIATPSEVAERVEIIRRRDAFERDRAAFAARWLSAECDLRDTIVAARKRLADVVVGDDILETAARLCVALGTDGLRGELSLIKAARASAALAGDMCVRVDHVRSVAGSALRHRLRRDPLDETGSSTRVARAVAEILG